MNGLLLNPSSLKSASVSIPEEIDNDERQGGVASEARIDNC